MSSDALWAMKGHDGARVPLAWPRMLAMHARITAQMDANLRARHSLTLREYEVLLWLSWVPAAGLSRTDLARSVHLTEGGITRLVMGLEKAEHVESFRGSTDRRVVFARLTPKGRRHFARAAKTHVADIHLLIEDRLSARELRTLAELLGRLDRDGSGP